MFNPYLGGNTRIYLFLNRIYASILRTTHEFEIGSSISHSNPLNFIPPAHPLFNLIKGFIDTKLMGSLLGSADYKLAFRCPSIKEKHKTNIQTKKIPEKLKLFSLEKRQNLNDAKSYK